MPNKISASVCILISLIVLAFTNTAKAGAVESGLIAYWSFEQDTITDQTVKDVFGDIGGEIKGDPEVTQGKVGEALLLDGDGDWVLVDSKALNRDYSEISVECWVYINELDDSWNRIVSLDDMAAGNNNYATLFYDVDDKYHGFALMATGTGPAFPQDTVEEGIQSEQWLHMMGTWDGEIVKYYEDGELKNSYSISGTVEGGNLFLCMGTRSDESPGDAAPCSIDEFRIYERALSEPEVKRNFAAEGLAVESNVELPIMWGQIKSLSRQ